MKGWIAQWKAKVPLLANFTATDLPGLIRPVLKLPLRVAVWVVPLVLEKRTFEPRGIVTVAGWNSNAGMVTVAVRLARAESPAEAAPPGLATSASAKTPAASTVAIACRPRRDLTDVVIGA
jgi:hypothetical protein